MKILVRSKWATDSKPIFPKTFWSSTLRFYSNVSPWWKIRPQRPARSPGAPASAPGWSPWPVPTQGSLVGAAHVLTGRSQALGQEPRRTQDHVFINTSASVAFPLLSNHGHYEGAPTPGLFCEDSPASEASQILLSSYRILSPVLLNLTTALQSIRCSLTVCI